MLKNRKEEPNLFQVHLPYLINLNHPLCKLSKSIDWESFDNSPSHLYSNNTGRPGKSIRLMIGLHYLKYLHNISDDTLVERWVENPYWQYFCGEDYFQIKLPIHPTMMTKFRNRLTVHLAVAV